MRLLVAVGAECWTWSLRQRRGPSVRSVLLPLMTRSPLPLSTSSRAPALLGLRSVTGLRSSITFGNAG
jgi:hypothetical protein